MWSGIPQPPEREKIIPQNISKIIFSLKFKSKQEEEKKVIALL